MQKVRGFRVGVSAAADASGCLAGDDVIASEANMHSRSGVTASIQLELQPGEAEASNIQMAGSARWGTIGITPAGVRLAFVGTRRCENS